MKKRSKADGGKKAKWKIIPNFFSHSFSLPLYVGIFSVVFSCGGMGEIRPEDVVSLCINFICARITSYCFSVSIVICFYLNEEGKSDTRTRSLFLRGIPNNLNLSRLGYHTQNIDNH